jgi:tetratricopeptide (TPR) repeat protein
LAAQRQGDLAAARSFLEEGLALFRRLNDERGISTCLNNLGMVVVDQGDYGGARSYYEESLVLDRARGDAYGIAASLHNLGDLIYHQGEPDTARAMFEEALTVNRQTGNRRWEAYNLVSWPIWPARAATTPARVRC